MRTIHGSVLEMWSTSRYYRQVFLFLLSALSLSPSLALVLLLVHTTEEQGCRSGSPLRSSDMQPGSQMIKAVAGGLHFETINRPVGAESNGKPSIPVSQICPAAQREGKLGGRKGSLHLCALSLCGSALLRGAWRSVGGMHGPSDVVSSRCCGFIHWTPPQHDQEQPQGCYIWSPTNTDTQ